MITMPTLQSFGRAALFLAAVLLAVGCDGFESGTPPNASGPAAGPTVSFAESDISITEEAGPVALEVVLNNPPANREVSVEILYADGVSGTEPADFNLPDDAAVGENAYIAGTVTFPAGAEDGATQTVELSLEDNVEPEDQEDGLFVLQRAQNATIGEPDQLTVAVGAIVIFSEDFGDEELAPMNPVSVASNENWGISSAGGAPNVPYAVANGFGGNEPANDWLITPALDFNSFEGETLTFLNAKNFDDGGLERGLSVKISTDYDGTGNPEDFTWTDISDRVENYSEGGFEFVSSGEVDLTDAAFQGDAVYVAFQYRSSGTGPGSSELWEVDSIAITGR